MQTKNVAIGVFYGPLEKEKLEKVTEIYNNLETQINQLNQSNEIIIGGDFNAKLELTHKTGLQTLCRNGKLLKTTIDDTGLTPTSTEAHTGFWTRVNRNKLSEKSVIDDIITTPTIHRRSKVSVQAAWKYINGSSQNMIDIKQLNDNHATWVHIIENNISGHIFHKSLFL